MRPAASEGTPAGSIPFGRALHINQMHVNSEVSGVSRVFVTLLRLTSVVLALGPLAAWAAPKDVMAGIMTFAGPYAARMAVFPAPDGSYWVSATGAPRETAPDSAGVAARRRRGPSVYVRHLGADGSRIGQDVKLNDLPGLGWVSSTHLVGFDSTGTIYLRATADRGGSSVDDWLVGIGPHGVKGVSSEPFDCLQLDADRTVIDASGRLRVFYDVAPRFGSFLIEQRGGDFVFADTLALPEDEVPPYLYWYYGRAYSTFGPNRLVAAVDRLDSMISLYVLDFTTLALLDSGQLRARGDEARVFPTHGPDEWALVACDSGGGWFFAPEWDISDRRYPNPIARLRAYRFTLSLGSAKPSEAESSTMRPFSEAPPGSRVVVKSKAEWTEPKTEIDLGVYKVKLDFWAYGSDGYLYHSTEVDSMQVPKRGGR